MSRYNDIVITDITFGHRMIHESRGHSHDGKTDKVVDYAIINEGGDRIRKREEYSKGGMF